MQMSFQLTNYTAWFRLLKLGTAIRVALTGLIYRKVCFSVKFILITWSGIMERGE